jgi:hypothetical protein
VICGAAHSACTADSGPILVTQLPARDARLATGEVQSLEPPAELQPPVLETEPPSFTTAEYARATHGVKKARR